MNTTSSSSLQARTVWLTRPESQNNKLQDELEKLGASVLALPMLIIRPISPTAEHKKRILNLDAYDLVFFISTNAARIGLELIHDRWPQYPSGLQNFAVGAGTAAVIESFGLTALYPGDSMSSEALLALPQLQKITGKKALILRGVGGREMLAASLQTRGCSVDYVELYERLPARYEASLLKQYLQQHKPDAVLLSSAEAMDNFAALFRRTAPEWRKLPLQLASQRLCKHAQDLGFEKVRVMSGAGDAAIISSLQAAFSEHPVHE